MTTITLIYTGPLPECGFTGQHGQSYVARPLEPFEVESVDVPLLLNQFSTVLKEWMPEKAEDARHSAATDTKKRPTKRDTDQERTG